MKTSKQTKSEHIHILFSSVFFSLVLCVCAGVQILKYFLSMPILMYERVCVCVYEQVSLCECEHKLGSCHLVLTLSWQKKKRGRVVSTTLFISDSLFFQKKVLIVLILTDYGFFFLLFYGFFQALCGVVFEVPTLAGDKLRISTMQEVIKPNTVKRITGYGLPLPKDPSRKGDMLVAFDIKFPEKLTASEKELLSDVLPSI